MLGGRIGPVLAGWREELGWTQEELAHRAGISRGYLSRLERDLPEQPGLAVLSRVCGAMGHSWAELYRDAGINLPGDVTLADIADGINDPELMLYLRRLPELDARDREILRALMRFLFERHVVEKEARRNLGQQLALPVASGNAADP